MISASLRSIADLCSSYPSARKIFVVPRGVSTNLSRALAREGNTWANALFVTPRDLAEATAGSRLRSEGFAPLHRDALMLWALQELPHVGGAPGSFFSRARFGASLVRSFVSTLESFRQAKITCQDILESEIRADKRIPFARLLELYESYLADEKLYDDAALFAYAANNVGALRSAGLLCVLGDSVISPIAAEFLESYPADERLVLGGDAENHSLGAAHSLAGWPDRTIGSGQPREFHALETLAPEHEVDAVLADILERGLSLDTVEIAYPNHKYLPLLASGILRLQAPTHDSSSKPGLPASFSNGIPLFQTFAGQALIGYLRWLADGRSAGDLARLAQGGFVTFRHVAAESEVFPDHLAGFLIRRQVGDGREAAFEALETWRVSLERDQYGSKRDLQSIDGLRACLSSLFDLVPNTAIVSAGDLIGSTTAFLKKFVRIKDDNEREQVNYLVEQISKLSSSRASGSIDEIASFLLELIRTRRTSGSSAKEGCVSIVPLEKSGYAGRSHLYVVGLDEQNFPGRTTTDPVLLDEERQLLSRDIPTRPMRLRQATGNLFGAIARCTESATLVYRTMDPIFGREMGRTTAVDHLFQTHQIKPNRIRLGASTETLTNSGAVLSQMGSRNFDKYAETHYPWLSDGYHALRERTENPLSEYSGFLGGRTPELDVTGADRTVSPSALERLARCPYLYFVRDVLKVKKAPSVERKPGRWLSALEFGNLLHQLLYEFMTTISGRGEVPDRDRHSDLIFSLLDEKIEEWREMIPAAGEVALERERFLLGQALTVFIGSETGRAVTPVAFEARFGDSSESTGRVKLADDLTLGLRGSIDRVDVGPDGYEIWDYKSGRADSFRSNLHQDPIHLQWALYAYVWTDILEKDGKADVGRSGYFFTSGPAYGIRVSAEPPDREVFGERLRPLLNMTAEGAFPHLQVTRQDACTFCDYKPVCGSERVRPRELPPPDIFQTETERDVDAVRKWAES